MSTADDTDTLEEIEIAYTLDHIQAEFNLCVHRLKTAKARGDIIAADQAQTDADKWLDRRNLIRGR